jgi:NAD(P)-dependent dehydrogenase (short-subunit alcohol dehydrogenase family)
MLEEMFGLQGRVALVTGGGGVLGGEMARGLARAGARVAVLGRGRRRLDATVDAIQEQGGEALALEADVLRREQLEQAGQELRAGWGRLDILVNAAGGASPQAVVGEADSIFELPLEAWREVVDLNLTGTLLPCQVFGPLLAAADGGSIVNISSMTAQRPLTKVVAYGVAKAGVDNLTRWLAVELARKHGPGLRVNAIAPGFFIGEQNRALMTQPDGRPTERGRAVIEHTPAGRFGEPRELVSTLVWLCGPGASFVTGTVIPVDGGFSAYAGV